MPAWGWGICSAPALALPLQGQADLATARPFLPGARHLQTGSGVRIALLSGATTAEGRQCTGQVLQVRDASASVCSPPNGPAA